MKGNEIIKKLQGEIKNYHGKVIIGVGDGLGWALGAEVRGTKGYRNERARGLLMT